MDDPGEQRHTGEAGRARDDPPPASGPAEWFTVPGRALLVATVAAAAGLFAWYFLALVDDLPAGRYPVVFFVAPVAFGAVLFFLAMAFVLERLGVRIYRRDRDP